MIYKTYAQARKAILTHLKSLGWELSLPSLKIPHATSPDSRVRLWFKPQAVWYTESDRGHHQYKYARSLGDFDYRQLTPDRFVVAVEKLVDAPFETSSTLGSRKRSTKPPPPKPPKKQRAKTIPPKSAKKSSVQPINPMGVVAQRRELQSQIREKRREVIPKLKQAVKFLEKQQKQRIKTCQSDCKAAQRKAKKMATVARRKLEQHIKRVKQRAQELCKSCSTVDEQSVAALLEKTQQLNEEIAAVKELRQKARLMRSERGRKGGLAAAEKSLESDSQVINNLDDNEELIALFKANRNKFKATPHMSRTEAFFEWLHDNPEALDEFRHKRERKFAREAERLYLEREPPPCTDELAECRRELDELRAAERFLAEAEPDLPF